MENRTIAYTGPSVRGTNIKIKETQKGYFILVMAMTIVDVAMCIMLAIQQVSKKRYSLTSLMRYAKESYSDENEEDDERNGLYTGIVWIDKEGNIIS